MAEESGEEGPEIGDLEDEVIRILKSGDRDRFDRAKNKIENKVEEHVDVEA